MSADETAKTEVDDDRPLNLHLADARAAARRAREEIAALEKRLDAIESSTDTFEGGRDVELVEPSWAEKLWRVPPETRLNASQAAEALGLSKSRLYKLTSKEAVPHRKMNGLAFVAGELRSWLRDNEDVVVEGHMELNGETDYLRRTS